MTHSFTTLLPALVNTEMLGFIRYLDQLPFLVMFSIIAGIIFFMMGILYLLMKVFCKTELNLEGVCMASELNAAVYGLMITLILVALFNAGRKTDESVSSEATHLLFLVRDSESLNNSTEIKKAIKNYIDIVVNKQWPLMCDGKVEEAKRLTPKCITPLYQVIQEAQPKGITQTSFYAVIPDILQKLDEVQRTRLKMADDLIPIQFWRVINIMTLIILIFLVYGGFRDRNFFLSIFAGLAVALDFSLLIAFHYPFLGPSAVSNVSLVQIYHYLANFGQHSSLQSSVTNMNVFDSNIQRSVYWLSGTSFHNLVFILFGGAFFILTIFILLLHRFRKSEEVPEGASMANTINASIYGLILAFFVVSLFDDNQGAKKDIDQEIGYLKAIVNNTQVLDNASQIQEAIKNYIKVVTEEQWPLLCAGKADEVLQSTTASLEPLYKVIRQSKPQNMVQEQFYASLPKMLHRLEEAQRARIMDANIHLPVQFWRTIILMTFITFIFLAYSNPWKGPATLIPILIPSIVIVFCLSLIITFHYPLIGPFKLSSEEYLKIDLSGNLANEMTNNSH